MNVKDSKTVGTKVGPEAREAVDRLCAAHGFSEYGLLQMLYDVAIRTMDDSHNLSYAMEQLMQIFDGMKDWKTSIRLSEPIKYAKIERAIYFLSQPKVEAHDEKVKREDGSTNIVRIPTIQARTGVRAVEVTGDPNSIMRTEDFNIHHMLENFICSVFPSMYRTLRRISVDLGTNSIYETLAKIVDDYNTNPDAEELRIMFSENDYSEQGKRMGEARAKSTRRPEGEPGLFD